jgi:hypothetical protein
LENTTKIKNYLLINVFVISKQFLKGRSFKGCVSYVLSNKDAKLLYSEGVLEMDTPSIINSLYMQSLMNPNLSKFVGHIPLAFSPEDAPRMTDQFMERLAKEYMKAMGIENTQYIVVRHNNTAHPHCHIVFNRVDNDGKTISDKNDRYRNEKVCKQLKDKYNLTYGVDKGKVNTQKLKGAEQTKYEIYYAVKNILPKVRDWKQFESLLDKQGISIEYKLKGQTNEVQGISFKKGSHSFKGSDVDRKFSYGKLNAQLNAENSIQEQQQQTPVPKETTGTITENIVSGVAGAVSTIGGLFDFQPSSSDADEAEYLRQEALKKKKKPKKRKGIRR